MREGHPYHPNTEMGSAQEKSEKGKEKKGRNMIDKLKYALKIAVLAGGALIGSSSLGSEAQAGPVDKAKMEDTLHKWIEAQEHQLRAMWQIANDKVQELDSVYVSATGEGLPDEVISMFQDKASHVASEVVSGGGTTEDYQIQLEGLFKVFKKTLLGEEDQGATMEQSPSQELTEDVATQEIIQNLPELPENAADTDWMWENIGKTFQKDGKIVSIASSKSSDQQTSRDKANLSTDAIAGDVFRTVTSIKDGIATRSSATVAGGTELQAHTRNINGIFETVMMKQYELVRPTTNK